MDATHKQRLTALMARTSTAALVTSLNTLRTPSSPEEAMARAWTIDELESRFPAAAQAVEAAFEEAEETGADVDYVSALLAHIPTA